jgi:uncharacterized protein involved in outer membrane biogenesis
MASVDGLHARARKTHRVAWVAAGLALVALVAAFDWTWFRPLIQQHVQQRSGRRIDFDRLQVGLDSHLAPIVRFHNLLVQNAPWASARPLVRATDLSATFDWAGFFPGQRIVVTRMTLRDADVDLEQQADGLRNWRITRPDDRGPGRIRVLTLDAESSKARYVNQAMQLELLLQTDPLPAPQVLPGHDAMPLTRTLSVRGTRHSLAFDGSFAVSDVISLFDSGRSFALRGEIGTTDARVSAQGDAHDLIELGGFDLDLHATGTRLGNLAPLFGRSIPAAPSLASDLAAHAHKEGRAWSASQLVARVGRSDLSGTIDYLARDRQATGAEADQPGSLRATLASQRIDVAEWRTRHGASTSAAPASAKAPARPASSPLDAKVDAQIDWQVASLDGLPLPLTGLRTHAAWRDERLTLSPLGFVLAGGRASGQLSLAEVSSTAELQLVGLRLEQLGLRDTSGRLNARIAVQSRGESIESMLASLGGSAEADLQGAMLPTTLDAKLGLDGGRWLRTLITDRHQRSAVHCSTLQVRFDKGVGTLQRLALETDNLVLAGSGSFDLPRRRVDVTITPHRKQSALFALDDSIRVDGALSAPKISLVRSTDSARSVGCASAPVVP